MNNKKLFPYLILFVLSIATFAIKKCSSKSTPNPKIKNIETDVSTTKGLNRNPSYIKYSQHAKCRMDCRHITKTEVEDILKTGTVNYKKCELDGVDCKKKYAVEGYSKDNQHLRIVFAPCQSEMTVVTCIDIGTQWECHCPGD
jgi:Domain of unknown function (DUF4258)